MSDNASTGAHTEDGESGTEEYDQMLEALDAAIQQAAEKVESGRVYDADNEQVRIKWIRGLAYAVNVRRQVVNDRKRGELEERLEKLEEMSGVDD